MSQSLLSIGTKLVIGNLSEWTNWSGTLPHYIWSVVKCEELHVVDGAGDRLLKCSQEIKLPRPLWSYEQDGSSLHPKSQ